MQKVVKREQQKGAERGARPITATALKRRKKRIRQVEARKPERAEQVPDWTPPKPHPWPKTGKATPVEIAKTLAEVMDLVEEMGKAKIPPFDAVQWLREDRDSKYR